LFKTLIQIETNTQLLHSGLRCKHRRLSPTRTNHFSWRWRWKIDTMTEPDATLKQWIGYKAKGEWSEWSG